MYHLAPDRYTELPLAAGEGVYRTSACGRKEGRMRGWVAWTAFVARNQHHPGARPGEPAAERTLNTQRVSTRGTVALIDYSACFIDHIQGKGNECKRNPVFRFDGRKKGTL